ncbi:MAG: hypothetical protein COA43_11830 [Robiginitomaculum sp.]|nr:MAG: hypothetical protein COA43_11830 [Robiginitomaculum sp.]
MKTRILPILGVLFALTIIGRGVAMSSESDTGHKAAEHAKDAHAEHPASAKANDHGTPHATAKSSDNADKEQCVTGDVLKVINAKMAAMKTREEEMARKETAFTAIEMRLKKEIAVIESAKNALNMGIEKRSKLAMSDLKHLTTMYESMKPKQAAKIFDKMDSKFAAGFIREMQSGQAGLILASMDTEQAYEVSLIIASRNAKYRPRRDKSLP